MKGRAIVLSACLALGCDYGGEESGDATWPCGEPQSSIIDTAAELEFMPGEGVGLLIEYLGEGEWRARTSCDTASSGYECYWDVIIWPSDGTEITDFATEAIDSGDSVVREWDGSLHLLFTTGTDVDGVTLQATPGGTLRFDALLDGGGVCANPYMYWIGDGAVHTGSPSSILDLTPSEP